MAGACIGANTILQTLDVLDCAEGRAMRDAVMALAGVAVPPADAGMLPEAECAAVHNALRRAQPDRAAALLRLSGLATGDYILRHRIPTPAQQLLPGRFAAPILARAIARHAWTFAGSGRFAITGLRPLEFELTANPLIAGQRADAPICDWHVAVFERLFSKLIWAQVRVTEVTCAATGAPSCRVRIAPSGGRNCQSAAEYVRLS